MDYVAYFDFNDGQGERGPYSLKTAVPEEYYCSESFKRTVSQYSCSMLPDKEFLAAHTAATGDTLVRILEDNALVFKGRVPPTDSWTSNGIAIDGAPDLSDISFEVLDYSEWLDREVKADDAIAWENQYVCDIAHPESSLLHRLLALCGISGTFFQPKLSIDAVLQAFAPDEGTVIGDAIDSLLWQYGYVLRWVVDHFEASPWLIEKPTSAINLNEDIVMTGLKIERVEREADGVEVKWYALKEKAKCLLYMADLPYKNDGSGFEGYPIEAGLLWPEEANVGEAWWNYEDTSLSTIIDSSGSKKKNTDFTQIVLTKNHYLDVRITAGIVQAFAPIFENKRARLAYSNPTSSPLDIYYCNIFGDVIYRGSENAVCKNTIASPKKTSTITAEFLHDLTSATRLACALADQYGTACRRAIFSSESRIELGTIGNLNDPYSDFSCLVMVIKRTFDPDTEIYSYTAISLSPITIDPTASYQSVLPEPKNGDEDPRQQIQKADITPPSIPSDVSASQRSTGALRVAFAYSTDSESGVAYYKIYRRETDTTIESAIGQVLETGAVSYTMEDTSPIIGKSYQYAVSAIDANGNESPLSQWTAAITSVVTDPPADVSSTTSIAYPLRMQVDWPSVPDATAYRIERSVNAGSSWSTLADVSTNRFDDPIAAGVEVFSLLLYRYRVKAISIYGALSSTWAVSAVPDTAKYGTYIPAAPTVSFAVAKRNLSALITPQGNLLNADGWDTQISRDGSTWYAPNPAAGKDADPWYTGSAGGTLKLNEPSLKLNYLPIPLDANSLPVATGQGYYIRVRARCSNPVAQSSWTTSAPLTVTPTLGADIAAAQVTAAIIASGAVGMAALASGIRPPRVVSALPANPYTGYALGDTVVLTTDCKLYRMANMSGAETTGWTAAVATADLSGTIAQAQIADLAINAAKLADAAVATAKLADDAVTTAKIAALAVTAAEIAAGAITTDKLYAGAVTAAKIAAGTITANEIAALTIAAANIAANAITTDKIAADAITAAKIAAGAVGADEIAANAITAAKISAGAVTADKLAVSMLSAIVANLGTVNAGVIHSYDWVSGVSGFSIDLDAGTIKMEDGSWSIEGGVMTMRATKIYGLNFEDDDEGTFVVGSDSATSYKLLEDDGEIPVGSSFPIPDKMIDGGGWMGDAL